MSTDIQSAIWNATAKEYHADHSAVSNTMLKHFDEFGPEGYERRYVSRAWIESDEEHFTFGKVLHSMVCEGHDFDSIAVVPPADVLAKNGARSTNAYYAWREEQLAAGKLVLNDADRKSLQAMVAALIRCNEIIDYVRAASRAEQSIRWRDEHYGIDRKARLDLIVPGYCILDIKSTAKGIGRREFARTIERERYHWQAINYTEAAEAAGFGSLPVWFVAMEKKQPHRVRLYRCASGFIDLANKQVHGDGERIGKLDELVECIRENNWLGRDTGKLITLDPPEYADRNDLYEGDSDE